MPGTVGLQIGAAVMAVAGVIALLRWRRARARGGASGGGAALCVACVCMLGACALVGVVCVTARGGTMQANVPAGGGEADDARWRAEVIGTWTDDYQGKRTMTIKADGTGTMRVELAGMNAVLFAERLRFDMVWSIENGRMRKRSIGGEPAIQVALVLKMWGDQADEAILELNAERLVLLDADGKTVYTWTRVS